MKKILLLLVFLNLITVAFSKPKTIKPTTVVILNFEDKSKIKNIKFKHYSQILPITISKNLNSDSKLSTKINLSANNKSSKELISKAKKQKIDFIITGNYRILNNKLILNTTITNIRGKESTSITNQTIETGVIIQKSIDTTTIKIKNEIEKFKASNLVKFKPSPYLPFYKAIEGTTVGINFERVYPTKSWGKIYSSNDAVGTFINVKINELIYIPINIFYLTMKSKDEYPKTNFELWSGSTGIIFSYDFSKYFGLNFYGGGGLALTKITVPSEPGPEPISETNSTDPILEASCKILFKPNPIVISFGPSYKTVLLKDEKIQLYGLSLSIGFKF